MFYGINRFHLCAFIAWQLANFTVGQYLFGLFSNHVPEWKCGNVSLPTRNCTIYKSCPKHEIIFVAPVFHSIAMDFDWVCESENWQSFFSLIQYMGVLCGTLTFGTLSDQFGRKPVGIFVLALSFCAITCGGMAPNQNVLLIARFFVGLSIAGVLVVICAWIMEVILPHQRIVMRGFWGWGWTRMFIPAVCYFTREWRLASFISAGFLIPSMLMFIFLIPESPTWLHNKGLTARMVESEMFIAKIAGIPYEPVEHKKIHSKTFTEIIKTKGLFRKLSVLWAMWFFVAVCGFAIDLNSSNLAGDVYLNQILFGILVASSKMILVTVDTSFPNFKRRTLHQGSQIGVIICFVTLLAFLIMNYHGAGFLIVYLLGTVFIEYNWDACYLCANESMETSSRTSAVGSCSFMARIGSLLAPFLAVADRWWPPAVYVTVIVIGSVNLLISLLFLQETKNVNLDDVHVDDSENVPEEVPMMQSNVK